MCVRQCDGAAAALPAPFSLPLRLAPEIRQVYLILDGRAGEKRAAFSVVLAPVLVLDFPELSFED